jgi:TonB family protein
VVKTKTVLLVTLIVAFSHFLGCATTGKTELSDPLYNDSIHKQWDKAPEVVYYAKPRYPVKAAKQRIQGKAIVAVTVAQNGSVLDVELYNSSGDSVLDMSAIEAAKKFKFRPAIKDGKAIQSTVILPVAFRIK